MRKFRGALLSVIIGSAAAVSISLWQMSILEGTASGRYTAWSNGFFTIAALWLGLGALTWIASFGGFDGMRYLVYVLRQKFSRKPKLMSYFDFRQERLTEKNHQPLQYLLIPGACFFLIAAGTAVLAMR